MIEKFHEMKSSFAVSTSSEKDVLALTLLIEMTKVSISIEIEATDLLINVNEMIDENVLL